MASVAGNFLQENENSNTDNATSGKDPLDPVGVNIKDKQEEAAGSYKGDHFERGSCSENASGSVLCLQGKPDDQRYIYMWNGYL